MDDLEKLFELIRERCEMDEVLDLCGIGMNELLLRLRGRIIEHRDRFESFLDVYEERDHSFDEYDDGDEDIEDYYDDYDDYDIDDVIIVEDGL